MEPGLKVLRVSNKPELESGSHLGRIPVPLLSPGMRGAWHVQTRPVKADRVQGLKVSESAGCLRTSCYTVDQHIIVVASAAAKFDLYPGSVGYLQTDSRKQN
ncbi:hypothetical protein AC579_6963 [Pseudocercospora musae]|uniref:Uncharacterized protein n=1 Tax=Pseudocercospora musae TaxID=113226 RepID=A0A139INS8_9PEZI|nr:hypothetical protein AC579_6963 [Pseudocercospora musae]